MRPAASVAVRQCSGRGGIAAGHRGGGLGPANDAVTASVPDPDGRLAAAFAGDEPAAALLFDATLRLAGRGRVRDGTLEWFLTFL